VDSCRGRCWERWASGGNDTEAGAAAEAAVAAPASVEVKGTPFARGEPGEDRREVLPGDVAGERSDERFPTNATTPGTRAAPAATPVEPTEGEAEGPAAC